MGKPITHITRNADQTISFHFSGSNGESGISPAVSAEVPERQLLYRMGDSRIWWERQQGQQGAGRKYVER